MFTGIVKEIGIIKEIKRDRGNIVIGIISEKIINEFETGASVSINGACQTVVNISNNVFYVESVEVTLKKTTLGNLRTGDKVNLEPALKLSEGLDGHIVQGHVDGVGVIEGIKTLDGSTLYDINVPEGFLGFMVEAGSIAVDGISLTIAKLNKNIATVSIIPFTLENTIICDKKVGDKVNIETDILGKYVNKILGNRGKDISKDWLKEVGFL